MLKDLINSNISTIIVDTLESNRVFSFLPEIQHEIYGTWDSIKGLNLKCGGMKYNCGVKSRQIDSALDYLISADKPHFVVFLDPDKALHIDKHCLIYAGQNVPSVIGAVQYKLPAPTEQDYIDAFVEAIKPKRDKKFVLSCAKYAHGMLIFDAVNCFKYSLHTSSNFLENRHRFVQFDILNIIDSNYSFKDLGGFDSFKLWFKKRSNLYTQEAKDYGLDFPRGVILAGKSGTGKSLAVKCLANESNLPLVQLDIGKVFNQHVGESEKNLRLALTSAERLSPCILWIDELSRFVVGKNSDGDSGTTSRIFATLLTWLQEHKEPVFVAATTNDFDIIPKELVRKGGRFSQVFHIDKPDFSARKEIWKIHLSNKGIPYDEDIIFKLSDKVMTGADIATEVEDILVENYFNGVSKKDIILRI